MTYTIILNDLPIVVGCPDFRVAQIIAFRWGLVTRRGYAEEMINKNPFVVGLEKDFTLDGNRAIVRLEKSNDLICKVLSENCGGPYMVRALADIVREET